MKSLRGVFVFLHLVGCVLFVISLFAFHFSPSPEALAIHTVAFWLVMILGWKAEYFGELNRSYIRRNPQLAWLNGSGLIVGFTTLLVIAYGVFNYLYFI
jgi:hypothetical protein